MRTETASRLISTNHNETIHIGTTPRLISLNHNEELVMRTGALPFLHVVGNHSEVLVG